MSIHNCTTIAVGKRASADGSVIIAHSDDEITDCRVIYVPARAPGGGRRPVYYDDASIGAKPAYNYTLARRYIGKARGPGYETDPDPSHWSRAIGDIPEVASTYAYLDATYAIMNEHHLMIGECTCGAKFHPEPEPGRRLFYSAELSRVALERCRTAAEAVALIGELIDRYGYYGTGETLLIGDREEAWVIEMCGYPDAVGTSFDPSSLGGGLWVAQRVPDDGVFVAANQFRIRDVYEAPGQRPADVAEVLHCKHLFEICRQQGWLGPESVLDWAATVSWGEYAHPYYSLRRVWRVLSRIKPSAIFSAWVDDGYTREYPVYVVPDRPLSVFDVAALYRDHYEGTEFDLTRGVAAGPYGDPNRYERHPEHADIFNLQVYRPQGAWERSVSIYRCGMTWINQAGGSLPAPLGGVSWIGLDRPAATCFLPLFANGDGLPDSLATMTITEFDRDSAWWAFNFVANYATLRYFYMMKDVRELQAKLEDENLEALLALDDFSAAGLRAFMNERVATVLEQWWRLAETLIVKYNAGRLTLPDGSVIMEELGYPTRTWLEQAGYFDGPTHY